MRIDRLWIGSCDTHWQLETRTPRGQIPSIAWSPSGQQVACAETSGVVRIFGAQSWRLEKLIRAHSDRVMAVRWSPDGSWLATLGEDHAVQTLRVWTPEGVPVIQVSYQTVNSSGLHLAWSPDSSQIAACFGRRSVSVRDRSGREMAELHGHGATVTAVAWSPNGAWLATGARDKTVRLWNMAGVRPKPPGSDASERVAGDQDASSGVSAEVICTHEADVTALCWSPDSERLAAGDGSRTIHLWRPSGESVGRWKQEGRISDLAWSPDGCWLASTNSLSVDLWKPDGTHARRLAGARNQPFAIAWSPDSNRLVAALSRSQLHEWSLQGKSSEVVSGDPLSELAERPVQWSPDVRSLTAASRDNALRFWNADGVPGKAWSPPGKSLVHVAWRGDGKTLATYSFGDVHVRFWGPDGTPGVAWSDAAGVSKFAWSPDGRRLAIGGWDGTIRLAKPDGAMEAVLRGHRRAVSLLAWSPDGRGLASVALHDDHTTVRLWKTCGEAGPVLTGHESGLSSIAWHPSSAKLATIEPKGAVRLWNVDGTGGSVVYRQESHGQSLAWSPDGKWLASCGVSIRFWNAKDDTGSVSVRLGGHSLKHLTWNPDGTWVAAQDRDMVRLVKPDGTTGAELHGMNLEPASATWSPDGRYLACTTQDKTVICWDVPSAATKWVGIGLAGGQVATLTANGTLIGEDVKVFDEQFVFAEQATTGQITPYTAGEFARLRNGRK